MFLVSITSNSTEAKYKGEEVEETKPDKSTVSLKGTGSARDSKHKALMPI